MGFHIYTAGVIAYALMGFAIGWSTVLLLNNQGYRVLIDLLLGTLGGVIGGFALGAIIGQGVPSPGVSMISLGLASAGAAITIVVGRLLILQSSARW